MREADNNASFSYESVSRGIAMDLLTDVEISKIAQQVAEDEEVRLVDYHLGKSSEEALGYLGNHLTLRLNLSSKEGTTSQRRFFVKTYEVRSDKEDFLGETGIFEREQDFYRVLVKDIKELVEEPDWCPKYHFSKHRVLVLEDLTEKGFKMAEGGQGPWALDVIHLEASLRALASMHSKSLLLERIASKSLPELYPGILLKDVLYDESKPESPTRKWIGWQIKDLLEGVDHLEKYSADEKALIRKNFEKQIMRIYNLSRPSNKYRNVFIHGDMWKNNLLFRYSNGNFPTKCKLVDFQFIRYSPPAHDVMHLLHYAMKREERNRMEPHFLRFYYENLRHCVNQHGANVEEEMTEKEFLQSCEEYRELALIQCLLSLHYILGPVTLAVEAECYEKYEEYLTKHRKEYMSKFFKNESYRDKIKDLFCELIDKYIIK